MKIAALLLFAVSAVAQVTNPLLPSGADPWIVRDGHTYYLMTTTSRNVTLRKADTLAALSTAAPVVVWKPAADNAYSKQLWAPEMHRIDGRWYIYVAADDGDNHHHRIYVLENRAEDPTSGQWKFLGKLNTPDDSWAIDLTVFEYKDKWYAVWAGWPGTENGVQNLYLARMKNPWTLEGERVLLSSPTYKWETKGDLGKPDGAAHHVDINEGPEVLQHDGRVFLTYSASGCWTDNYALGMLTLAKDGDPLDAKAWTKSQQPVFTSDASAHAFGTGHNGFFPSPDGKQNWIVYHANPEPHMGCRNKRATRVQPFTWNADGTPHFGKPVPLGESIPSPSGEEAK